MPDPELVRTSIKLPSDLLDEITLASDAWAKSEGYLPTGSRNNWIIKVLRRAVEEQRSSNLPQSTELTRGRVGDTGRLG